MKLNKRKCKECGELFQKLRPLQSVCGYECSILKAKKDTKKKQDKKLKEINKDVRERKEKLKTTSDYLKELQVVFNQWIRLRDKDLPCISCGKFNGSEQAGHYMSVGGCPELRFNEDNVHGQCIRCNMYLHANLIPYRQNLIKKIGISSVEWLESNHEPKHYNKAELIGMKVQYKQRIKDMK
jgi:hypothetical protein